MQELSPDLPARTVPWAARSRSHTGKPRCQEPFPTVRDPGWGPNKRLQCDGEQRPLVPRSRDSPRLKRSVRRSTRQSSKEKKGDPMGKEDFVGTWHLVSSEFRRADGAVTYPIGKDAVGLLIYTAEGYMAAQL